MSLYFYVLKLPIHLFALRFDTTRTALTVTLCQCHFFNSDSKVCAPMLVLNKYAKTLLMHT